MSIGINVRNEESKRKWNVADGLTLLRKRDFSGQRGTLVGLEIREYPELSDSFDHTDRLRTNVLQYRARGWTKPFILPFNRNNTLAFNWT